MFILSVAVAIVLGAVALLHFYWAFGGLYGLLSAGPKIEGRDEFIPPKPIIFMVACLIVVLAVIAILLASGNRPFGQLLPYCGYAISAVFIIRSIGDFKYLGFFKKIYNSSFSKKDTLYFSPLCLMLGLAFFVLVKYSA